MKDRHDASCNGMDPCDKDHTAETMDAATFATIRGSFLAADHPACAVQSARDALLELHKTMLWYGENDDAKCERANLIARTAWAALQDLSDQYREMDAAYLEDDGSEEAAA